MGCARFIYNAKCEEQEYFYRFKTKYLPINTYAPVDQCYSQFKSKELTPWLYECPSILLRNTAYTWKNTFSKFLKGECGKPKKKRKGDRDSVWLTSELFRFEKNKLFIGNKKYNLGELAFKAHRPFKEPKSIRIKKIHGKYHVSFCYDGLETFESKTQKQHLTHLAGCSKSELEKSVVGIDRGVVIPLHTGLEKFDFSKSQKKHQKEEQYKILRLQKHLSRQKKGSNHRVKTKEKLGRAHERTANIRKEFAHQSSHKIVSNENNKIIVLEDLKTKNMTKKPKAKKSTQGKWLKNNAKAKAGLNKAILNSAWHLFEMFCAYKAHRLCKAFFKVSPSFTSQECADCGHIHPDNRKKQSLFVCESCGNSDNADKNAALVIKNRAINLILNSGTELSSRGVLTTKRYGAWSRHKTKNALANLAIGVEASKKTNQAALAI